jgi:hypothetical protein
MLQATAGPGRQLWQTGPAPVIAATRRQFPHLAHGFQLRGSRRQQFWQMGCPLSLRRAGDLTAPHRPQRSARAFLTHPAHRRSPSTRALSCLRLPQRGHGGSTTTTAPALTSALMNRKTPGNSARAPWPVSRPGRSTTARAMRRAATCPRASKTTSELRTGSSSDSKMSRASTGSPEAGLPELPVTAASR